MTNGIDHHEGGGATKARPQSKGGPKHVASKKPQEAKRKRPSISK